MDDKRISYKEEDGKVHLHYSQDVEPLLEANAELRANSPGRFEKKGEFNRVMRVPHVVLMDICQKTGLDFFNPEDAKTILQILRGRDYLKFRTVDGNI